MNKILVFVTATAFAFAVILGKQNELSNAAISGAAEAVSLVIVLVGGLAFWGGIMRLAQKCGICDFLAKLLSPVIKIVFKGLDNTSNAAKAICMNISANLIGLGNAATPFGIEAMRELSHLNKNRNYASDYMIYFVVLNSSSIQLIPTTLSLLRAEYGSQNPMDILLPSFLTSIMSLAVGLITAWLLSKLRRKK